MPRCPLIPALCFTALLAVLPAAASRLASAPPMGWNSWDAYGLTIGEDDFRANAQVLASLKDYGWQYAVVDEGWYMQDPFADSLAARKYVWDEHGILNPAVNRFPSAADGQGFKPLADWAHAQGLKFGIHLVRGIPRDVVKANLPIAGSGYHAADAADISSPCPWDEGNWGIRDNEAGQAYYDSMLRLYASWGVDFLKVDCISDHPYRPTEIRQIAEAIRKSGRSIVLSLSPGPTQLEHAAEVAKYAQMWRISDDHWDLWNSPHAAGSSEFPFGIRQAFDRIAEWTPHFGPGHWPDPDMLPVGSLTPHPGWGDPRTSRYTQDEQRTEFTLWAISRSPLILGANLTKLDDFTRSLITNKDAIEINQHAIESGQGLMPLQSGKTDSFPQRYWYARTSGHHYLAVFNLEDKATVSDLPWPVFHVTDQPHKVYDIWNKKHIRRARALHVELPPHACAVFRLE
ncbi:MAG: glycoside hydrolase family 27 protein [Terracidiphilus sp.]|nr:glycoside hydrolase family 27 protein [Terracidiphilus sp.]